MINQFAPMPPIKASVIKWKQSCYYSVGRSTGRQSLAPALLGARSSWTSASNYQSWDRHGSYREGIPSHLYESFMCHIKDTCISVRCMLWSLNLYLKNTHKEMKDHSLDEKSRKERKNMILDLLSLYFQIPGHSISIIGFEYVSCHKIMFHEKFKLSSPKNDIGRGRSERVGDEVCISL